MRVGREYSISRGRLDCRVEIYMSEESEEKVRVLRVGRQHGKQLQEFSIWRGKVVSTVDKPIWSRCSIALTCPARSHRARKDGARIGMNVAAHQEKDEKTGKRRAEERTLTADFEEAVCCLSVVVQGAAWRKNEGECPG